ITKIAEAHQKTPAQVVLRWHLQANHIVIPKSVTPSRIEQNFAVFDFELTTEEMAAIAEIDRDERTGPEPSEMNMR
ncbi:aldo/keto reductase, partial [Virgibacillus pantothenticus]